MFNLQYSLLSLLLVLYGIKGVYNYALDAIMHECSNHIQHESKPRAVCGYTRVHTSAIQGGLYLHCCNSTTESDHWAITYHRALSSILPWLIYVISGTQAFVGHHLSIVFLGKLPAIRGVHVGRSI